MPILDQLRRFIHPLKSSSPTSSPPSDLPPTQIPEEPQLVGKGTQAEKLAQAMLAVEPDVKPDLASGHEHEPDGEDFEVTDASHLSRIEPKPLTDEIVSPQEFNQTTNVLTEGIDELRRILAEQSSLLEAIAPNLSRVDQAISEHEALASRIEMVHGNLESLTDQMTRVLGSMNHLTERVTSVQQLQQTQSDQLKSQEGSTQQVGQKLTTLEHNQRESSNSQQTALDRIAMEASALDHRLSSQRTLVVLAAVGATTAAILSLIALITS